MHEPMVVSTLVEAATWLTEAMGRAWTEKQVLDAVLRTCSKNLEYPPDNFTCLRVLPPRNTVLGLYTRDPETYAHTFRGIKLNYRFQLSERYAQELFDYGQAIVSIVKTALTGKDPHVVIEPRSEPLKVTIDMLRIGASDLKELAKAFQQDSKLPYVKQDDYLYEWDEPYNRRKLVAYAYLTKVAQSYNWDNIASKPIILKSLEPLDKWDGSVLAILKQGPQVQGPQLAVSVPSASSLPLASPAERRAQLDITRERGARRRILENWENIEKLHGPKADGRQVLRFLKRELQEEHPALKTIQNHLSALRSEGLIP